MSVEIVSAEKVTFSAWKAMWIDYLGQQAEALSQQQHQDTYSRLTNPEINLFCLIARIDEPVGFAHFYFHPSTHHSSEDCCLQDVYVAPSARGRGLGQALVEAVAAKAKGRGAPVLHWKTRESKIAAQSMYSRFAQRTEFVLFRLAL